MSFADVNVTKVKIPNRVEYIGFGAFAGIFRIELSETLPDHLNECHPFHTCLREIGIYHYDYRVLEPKNEEWSNHLIVIRSKDTDEIICEIPMFAKKESINNQDTLRSMWKESHELRFNYKKLDDLFDKLKLNENKMYIAITRTKENSNIGLTKKRQKIYDEFIIKSGVKLVKTLINNNDVENLEYISKYGLISKTNLKKLIKYAEELNRMEVLTLLKNLTI